VVAVVAMKAGNDDSNTESALKNFKQKKIASVGWGAPSHN